MKPVALGDLHGRHDLLTLALAAFQTASWSCSGTCGPGPDSLAVVATVRGLVEQGRAACCLGNHDQMLIDVVLYGKGQDVWLRNGGAQTLRSYGQNVERLTADARWMEANLQPWIVQDGLLFAHAMRPALSGFDRDAHLWGRPDTDPLYDLPPDTTLSVHGHTIVDPAPQVLRANDGTLAYFIDAGSAARGRLCALDCQTMEATLFRLAPTGVPQEAGQVD